MNAVKLGSKPASLAGAQLIYEDRESGIYKLDFTAKRVSWRCIDGSFTGESGSAAYRACQADPATLLIAWSQPTGEAAVSTLSLPGNGGEHRRTRAVSAQEIAPANSGIRATPRGSSST